MYLAVFALVITFLFASSAPAQNVVRPRSSLWKSTDCEYDPEERGSFCKYLRFYPDGTVIAVTTLGNPNEIKHWFSRPYSRTGTYTIIGNTIRYSTTGPEGTIDEEGVLAGDTLRINWFSHINQRSGVENYRWVRPRPRRHRPLRPRVR